MNASCVFDYENMLELGVYGICFPQDDLTSHDKILIMEIDPKEIKKLLYLVEENNTMLRRMRAAQKRAWWLSFFKYVILIAIAFGAYYLIQPFVENLNSAYGSVLNSIQSIQEAGETLDKYR